MRGGRGEEPARPARTGGAGRDPEYRDAIPHHCSPPGCTHKHQLQFFYFMHFINKLFMPCLVCPLFDFLCSCRHTTQNLHYTLYIVNKGRRCNMLHSLVLKFQPVTSTSTNAKHTTVQSYSATRVMVCPCLPTVSGPSPSLKQQQPPAIRTPRTSPVCRTPRTHQDCR